MAIIVFPPRGDGPVLLEGYGKPVTCRYGRNARECRWNRALALWLVVPILVGSPGDNLPVSLQGDRVSETRRNGTDLAQTLRNIQLPLVIVSPSHDGAIP